MKFYFAGKNFLGLFITTNIYLLKQRQLLLLSSWPLHSASIALSVLHFKMEQNNCLKPEIPEIREVTIAGQTPWSCSLKPNSELSINRMF